jgi:hypothetical protein
MNNAFETKQEIPQKKEIFQRNVTSCFEKYVFRRKTSPCNIPAILNLLVLAYPQINFFFKFYTLLKIAAKL